METLIAKLNRIAETWKAQFQPPYEVHWTPKHFKIPPDFPLVWTIENGILFLDNVWIAPVKFIRTDKLNEALEWVNPVTMEIDLVGGTVNIIIRKWMDKYSIAGVRKNSCLGRSLL